MNRFCGNLLAFVIGIAVLIGGVMACKAGIQDPDWEMKSRIGAVLFGGLGALCGSLLCFAACLGWRKAWDAENLFGKPIDREAYWRGYAIPYVEMPMALSWEEIVALPGANRCEDGSVCLPAQECKANLLLYPADGEPRNHAEVTGEATRPKRAKRRKAVAEPEPSRWKWCGILRGDGWLPLQDTSLSHINSGWHIKGLDVLFGKKANAVLISDGSKVLVYTPRKLASVQSILKQHGLLP